VVDQLDLEPFYRASEEATVALSTWAYRGRGYRIPQGARLAVASAARARARTA
jgi:hypothetical protein